MRENATQWKQDRHMRMRTACNRVESRRREIRRQRVDEERRQRKVDMRTSEIPMPIAGASGGRTTGTRVTETDGVGSRAIRQAQKLIRLENLKVHREHQRQHEELLRQQEKQREEALQIARDLDRAMRSASTDPRSGV